MPWTHRCPLHLSKGAEVTHEPTLEIAAIASTTPHYLSLMATISSCSLENPPRHTAWAPFFCWGSWGQEVKSWAESPGQVGDSRLILTLLHSTLEVSRADCPFCLLINLWLCVCVCVCVCVWFLSLKQIAGPETSLAALEVAGGNLHCPALAEVSRPPPASRRSWPSNLEPEGLRLSNERPLVVLWFSFFFFPPSPQEDKLGILWANVTIYPGAAGRL